MRAVVLLPGPSLSLLTEPPPCDVLIGVKRAATVFTCHWAAVLDIPCLRKWAGALLGQPQLVTRSAYRPKYTALPGVNVEGLQDYCPALDGKWTSTAALALAGFLHASEVVVYGADFGAGPTLAEFGGFESPEANYTVERWARETAAWGRVVDWLAGRGVSVERVGAGSPAL